MDGELEEAEMARQESIRLKKNVLEKEGKRCSLQLQLLQQLSLNT